jgi:hypothetical protein
MYINVGLSDVEGRQDCTARAMCAYVCVCVCVCVDGGNTVLHSGSAVLYSEPCVEPGATTPQSIASPASGVMCHILQHWLMSHSMYWTPKRDFLLFIFLCFAYRFVYIFRLFIPLHNTLILLYIIGELIKYIDRSIGLLY